LDFFLQLGKEAVSSRFIHLPPLFTMASDLPHRFAVVAVGRGVQVLLMGLPTAWPPQQEGE
jgi:hypothetical protein